MEHVKCNESKVSWYESRLSAPSIDFINAQRSKGGLAGEVAVKSNSPEHGWKSSSLRPYTSSITNLGRLTFRRLGAHSTEIILLE